MMNLETTWPPKRPNPRPDALPYAKPEARLTQADIIRKVEACQARVDVLRAQLAAKYVDDQDLNDALTTLEQSVIKTRQGYMLSAPDQMIIDVEAIEDQLKTTETLLASRLPISE